MPDSTWVGDHRLELDGIDKRLFEGDILDARVVESVDIVPDYSISQSR
jgi:hypothetical protein